MASLRAGRIAREIRNARRLGQTDDHLTLISCISTGTDYPREEATIVDLCQLRHTAESGDEDSQPPKLSDDRDRPFP
jgi:hypothetical protein